MSRFITRFAATTLLVLCAGAGTTQAATQGTRRQAARPAAARTHESLVARAWSFFHSFWEAEGSSLDPFGKPTGQTAPIPTNSGNLTPLGK
jgi:hypothetical protein